MTTVAGGVVNEGTAPPLLWCWPTWSEGQRRDDPLRLDCPEHGVATAPAGAWPYGWLAPLEAAETTGISAGFDRGRAVVFQDEVDVNLNPDIGDMWDDAGPPGSDRHVRQPMSSDLAGSMSWHSGELVEKALLATASCSCGISMSCAAAITGRCT